MKLIDPSIQPEQIPYGANLDSLRGRFSNVVSVMRGLDFMAVDFFASTSPNDNVQHIHIERIFLTPRVALELAELLKKQAELQAKLPSSSPLKK